MSLSPARTKRRIGHLLVIAGLLGGSLGVFGVPGGSPSSPAGAKAGLPTQIGWGLYHTCAVVAAGKHIWTLSNSGAYLTEFSAKTGTYEQTVQGAAYGLTFPTSFALSGKHLWVADYNGSLVQIAADSGALEQRITDSSYGLNRPNAIVAVGADVWVANWAGNSLTQINGSTGAFEAEVSDPSYLFNGPSSLAVAGSTLWVSNAMGDSVTGVNLATHDLVRVIPDISHPGKLAVSGKYLWISSESSEVEYDTSTGTIVRTLSDSSYGFGNSVGIGISSTQVWFGNINTNSATLVDATTGAMRKHLSSSDRGFSTPTSMAVSGNMLLIGNYGDVGLIEMNKKTGTSIRTISGSAENFSEPSSITKGPNNTLWVTSISNNSVTELSSVTGKVIQVFNDPSYGFDGPVSVAVFGRNVWVVNDFSNSLTEFDARSGALIRIIRPDSLSYPVSMCMAGSHLFVGNSGHGVTELDATTGDPIHYFSDIATPNVMVASAGYVYATGSSINGVFRITVSTETEITYDVGYAFSSPLGITSASGHVWVTNPGNDSIVEFNQATGDQELVLSGSAYGFDSPHSVVSANGLLYVTNSQSGTVSVVDAESGNAVDVLRDRSTTLSHPSAAVVASGSLWITNFTGRSITRIPL